MKHFTLPLLALAFLGLSACQTSEAPQDDTSTPPAEQQSSSVLETRNVLYRGIVRVAGMSIYMQGTHKLQLKDGRFILLESTEVDLDGYIGDDVEVFGDVRPTVEAGGVIMRVRSIARIGGGSSSVDTATSSSSLSSASSSSLSTTATVSSVRSSVPTVSSSSSSSSSSVPSAASIPPSWEASSELAANAAIMAKHNMESGNWTQRYCSTHVGFCVPIHKNWWFLSFGATSGFLWHVEVGAQEIHNMGEGPISINLVSGAGTDGTVRIEGDTVIGVRSFDGSRHLEIRAPLSLETAVRFMTQGVTLTAG